MLYLVKDLRRLTATAPGLWHAILYAGTLHPRGLHIEVDPARLASIFAGRAAPTPAAIPAPVPSPPTPIPRSQWPRWAHLVALRATSADVGVGDTIARVLGSTGQAYKTVFKRLTGRACGCTVRQAWFNLLYPYGGVNTPLPVQ